MKILDKYIISKYLVTFFVMLLLFIPIGILVDLSEKIDKLKEYDVPLNEIFEYYTSFVCTCKHLYPIFVLAVIWFTSKLLITQKSLQY